jgi:hypothetical protein
MASLRQAHPSRGAAPRVYGVMFPFSLFMVARPIMNQEQEIRILFYFYQYTFFESSKR